MTQPTTAPQTALELDATDQAVELLRKLSAGEGITGRGAEKDCAAVMAAALIAQASELREIGRLLGALVARGAALTIPTGDEDAEDTEN